MGTLIYGATPAITIADRELGHLHWVIALRLHRHQGLMVHLGEREAGERYSVWMSAGVPLQLRYSGSRTPVLNQLWIRALTELSHSAQGLTRIPEAQAEEVLAELQARRAGEHVGDSLLGQYYGP